MPWEGKPLWDGEYVECRPIEGKMFPAVLGSPMIIQIEGCPDFFVMVFSTLEKLQATTDHFLKKLGMPVPYAIGKIESEEFLEYMMELKLRVMFDPIVIDDHHTKWGEIVKEQDRYKYVDPRAN